MNSNVSEKTKEILEDKAAVGSLPPDQVQPFDNKGSKLKEFQRKLKFFWGSLFYLTYAPQAYYYSWKRDRLEKQFPTPPTEIVDNPGKLTEAEAIERGAKFYFEQA